jgi:hypothetical protein
VSEAARAARELLAAGVEDPVLLAVAAVACVRAGEAVTEPPVAAALAEAACGRVDALLALPTEARVGALDAAAEVVPAAAAPALGRVFLADGAPPLSGRLALLCAAAEPALAARLLEAAAALGDDVWAGLAGELVLAGRAPAGVEERLAALDPHGLAERELLTLRLRRAARDDPAAALPLVREALDAVGVHGVESGVEAVLGRLGPAGAEALADRSLGERALAWRAALWEAGGEAAALEPLVTALGPEEPDAGHELLAAAARLGDAALAGRVVDAWSPPAWAAWNAVWAPLRKRGSDAQAVLDAVERALPADPAADSGPPPEWAELPAPLLRRFAELRSRPDLGLPWWRPWEGGLP